MKENYHIADLIAKKIKGIISPVEQEELDKWIHENPENQAVYERATDSKKQLEKLEVYSLFDKEKAWSELEDKLFETKTLRFTPQKMLSYAAAIILPLLIAGGFAYRYLNRSQPQTLAEIDTVFQPGSQKAVLILADGGSVELEEGVELAELEQGASRINIRNSFLSYTSSDQGSRETELIYNELRTPRGGGYNLRLADGTGVWLNAGSSIRFPVTFGEDSRQVYLEGEAYFEVSHNGAPFIVSVEDMDVRVLGTSFNISAYEDEPLFKTTLVEGKVSVELRDEDSSGSLTLNPDHQAVFKRSESELSDVEVNASNFTSWMRGKLEFNNETLDQVMKRLARWYDFEYDFENEEAKNFHFSARLNNGENISTIINMLEMTTDVKFELRDQKIVVL